MRGLRQEKRPVGAGVYDTACIIRRGSISATHGVRRSQLVPIAIEGVVRDRSQDWQPLLVLVDRINLRESFVNVGHRGDQRSALHQSARSRLPVERITPAIFLVTAATGILQNLKEVDGPLVILMPS